ncbi:MAG: hypothetical protein K2X87_32450 [Gemmataceae bacterium]|nr:hypothetical protein [Gemmataceae bacterium]
MRFTVVVIDPAEQGLAAAWLASADRNAVADAAHRMERLLAAHPLDVGEDRASSVSRVGFVPPLGFTFDVVVDDATVYVTDIWLTS